VKNRQEEPLWLQVATLVAICAFLFFYGLGSFGLVGADEPRYAQIAREMLARHDWVTPVLNGVPWLEKPVLYYWGAMFSYRIFGVSDWAARIPSAVLASAMVLAAYAFMRRFRRGSESNAAVILASLAGVIGFARAASTDMALASTLIIALLSWYAWFETRRVLWLAGFYAFLALGTLAKGPIAPFLAAAIVLAFVLLRRDWTTLRKTLSVPGLLLYFAVALPWYILVQHANPQFVKVFIFEHNLARYGTNMFQHKQPFWYFIPVLVLGILPWVTFSVAALVRVVKENLASRNSFELFFGLWAVLPVVFFSFSQSKLPGYILPVLPAFAILTADYIWWRQNEGNQPPLWMTALHSTVGGILLGLSLLSAFLILKAKLAPLAILIAVIAGVAIFIGMTVAVYAKGLDTVRFATLVPVVIALAFVLKMVSPAIDAKDSERPVAARLARFAKPGTPVAVAYVPRVVEYGLNFYRNQPIANYERGEIPPGEHVVVGRPGATDVLEGLTHGRKIVDLGEFKIQGLEFYLVAAVNNPATSR
jgi:4-amino-4-deoxy-L-arabinose transferase-like glycosyltransferase